MAKLAGGVAIVKVGAATEIEMKERKKGPRRGRAARDPRGGLNLLVGAARFELATTCTPCRYATRLRYAPTREKYIRAG